MALPASQLMPDILRRGTVARCSLADEVDGSNSGVYELYGGGDPHRGGQRCSRPKHPAPHPPTPVH